MSHLHGLARTPVVTHHKLCTGFHGVGQHPANIVVVPLHDVEKRRVDGTVILNSDCFDDGFQQIDAWAHIGVSCDDFVDALFIDLIRVVENVDTGIDAVEDRLFAGDVLPKIRFSTKPIDGMPASCPGELWLDWR